MKKITALLLTCAFTITSNSFGMEPEEAPSNHYPNFDKIAKRQLQEKNNTLLQENNRLLHEIKRQNKVIINQNYVSFEHEILLVESHRSLAVSKSEKKTKSTYQEIMRTIYETEKKYDKI